ncbi:MAG: Txe/YoeB family addiction module toxin [Mucilaginibacter sp.]
MEIVYTLDAKEDIDYWKKSGSTTRLKKIRSLLENILETPFEGIGKPEPLKYGLTGAWSRRIDHEHRLVYKVERNEIIVLGAKGHYKK